MAEGDDKESKTEEATEKKIRDSIEKEIIPYSREAATLASLLGILFIGNFLVDGHVARLSSSLMRLVDNPGGFALENHADAVQLFHAIAIDAARLLIPIFAVLAAVGVLSSVAQNSPRIVVERVRPQLSRISLTSGWQRVFGTRGQVEFLKSAFKLAAVCSVGFLVLRAARHDMWNAIFVEPSALPKLITSTSLRLIATIAGATIVLVAADLVWSQVFWRRDLRMTRQEVKDELKQVVGDPIVRSKLRSLARDRLRKRMIAAVPRATMVIANPTHFAVALRYVREEGGAPLVVAKGQDLIALKIREVAVEHNIPIVEDKALARSLYKAVEVDKMIPAEFYKAVAEIVLFLFARGMEPRPA